MYKIIKNISFSFVVVKNKSKLNFKKKIYLSKFKKINIDNTFKFKLFLKNTSINKKIFKKFKKKSVVGSFFFFYKSDFFLKLKKNSFDKNNYLVFLKKKINNLIF